MKALSFGMVPCIQTPTTAVQASRRHSAKGYRSQDRQDWNSVKRVQGGHLYIRADDFGEAIVLGEAIVPLITKSSIFVGSREFLYGAI